MKQRTITTAEKTAPFHIQPFGSADEYDPFLKDPLLRLPHFEFIWIKKGSGLLSVDFKEYTLTENTIYCLSPGQLRQITVEKDLRGYYFSLSGEFYFTVNGRLDYSFLFDRFSTGKNISVFHPETERLYELNDLISLMIKEYHRNGLAHLDILGSFLRIFMLYLSREPAAAATYRPDSEAEKVKEFIALVKKNFLTKKMVADYASDMAISPGYLNCIVKKISGFNASYHIQQCIILEAKRQMFLEN